MAREEVKPLSAVPDRTRAPGKKASRSARLLRTVKIMGGVILLLAIVLAAVGYYLPRRSFPQTSGEVRPAAAPGAQGISNPVDILRDEYGIPHIFASTQYDLFFAQGYVHAQDRFWQMDFWRHAGSGRLSELFGDSQVETDQFLRTLGFRRVAQQELDTIDPESLSILQAYADGVNAYLAERTGSALSLEYAVLSMVNRGYSPELWQPLHTLTYAKMMAWDLGGNMSAEIARAMMSKTLTPEQMSEVFSPYPEDNPVVVSGFQPSAQAGYPDGMLQLIPELMPLFSSVSEKNNMLNDLRGSGFDGIGSNNWVVSGDLTTSGMPLLADDPHLGVQMPSIWYQNGLYCVPVSTTCPYQVTGFSFASAPGVIVGHNGRIAWGVTNVGPDVQDLYIERINPHNPRQYEVDGQWVDMEAVTETILTAGGDAVELTVLLTRNGPVITEVYGPLENIFEDSGLQIPPGQYAISLRWTALEPSFIFRSVLNINRAQNWEDFREALRDWDVPSQNFVYADVEGNIGYQMPGKVPIRAGGDGSLPAPGWIDDYQWTGFIPFEELPHVYNPPEGYIVTANNAVVDEDYPYFISRDWDRGFRARRLVDMIEERSQPIDVAFFQQMHGDNKDLNAAFLVPVLLKLNLEDERLENARSILEGWDYQARMDSGPAALFQVFWKNLLELAFSSKLPESHPATGSAIWVDLTRRMVDQPDSPWWDNPNTSEREDRNQVFRQAFAAAVDELEGLQGTDTARWNWGDLHTVTFRNPTLGISGPEPIRALFNRGPFRTSGGSSIVNATGWNPASSSYEVRSLPSMRMIVDMDNLHNSWTSNTTGQSGHAYHKHYIDMAEDWRLIQYHPMLWGREVVEAGTVDRLRLVP
jgi:penicillin G amidase